MVDDATVKYYKDMGMTPQSLEKLQVLIAHVWGGVS
jgi:hypothetical protein